MKCGTHCKAIFSHTHTGDTQLSLSSMVMAMAEMIGSILGLIFLIMLLAITLSLAIACKPWRFFSRSFPPPHFQIDDLERPLVWEDSNQLQSLKDVVVKNHAQEGSYFQTEGHFNSAGAHSVAYNQRPSFPASNLTQGSLVLEIDDPSEDDLLGQTLKHPLAVSHFIEEQKQNIKENLNHELLVSSADVSVPECLSREIAGQGSSLNLEVITGPSRGIRYSARSSYTSKPPLTLGRVPPSDLVLKDSEISGKHALINWNLDKLKWELIDKGSLNGTLLNSRAVHHPDTTRRHWGDPVELADGDIITLGRTSQIHVEIASLTESEIPFGVGIASDPMALRHGGKKLPMEDVCHYQWPLPGADQFGIFGICDGHGGANAADSASKILPEMVATILSNSMRREKVLSARDASDVLREAFSQTEASMNHCYEGCTATVLLVWTDSDRGFFAQCANVGDSACVMNIDGKQIKMTDDHRITSYSERQRIKETGDPLKDGDTRLCGLNLARMLGDEFLKEQDARFSSQPYISQVVHIDQASEAFVLLASDGLWDVVSTKKAIQFVLQAKAKYSKDGKDSAEKIANLLLNEARTLRTKDNTSIVYLDFDHPALRTSCKYDS